MTCRGAEGSSVVEDIIPYAISAYKARLEPSNAQETYIYNFNTCVGAVPLTFVLINAVKEQQKHIENQQKEIKELESKMIKSEKRDP